MGDAADVDSALHVRVTFSSLKATLVMGSSVIKGFGKSSDFLINRGVFSSTHYDFEKFFKYY
jgi:hypothetical protein